MRSEFARQLKSARKSAGITQYAAAQHVQITQTYYADVENGKRNPLDPERIRVLAQYFETEALPLIIAAGRERGRFELPVSQDNDDARCLAAATLSERWRTLPNKTIKQILSVLGDPVP